MAITIEKNIPLPIGVVIKRKTLYPFASMKKGDSFWAPNRHSAIGASSQYRKKYEPAAEFVEQPESQGTVNGVRIWKVK
jgi:hypothetical protein